MRPRVLHVLSQRPGRTGSGVTLEALVEGAREGWDQQVVVGVPAEDPRPQVGHLDNAAIHPLVFEEDVPFALPGMSDVMPYESRTFSSLGEEELELYREAWRRHLEPVVDAFRPDVIHVHHIWILSSLIKEVAPDVPVVNHCHATGLRQMALCPHLADDVRAGCRLHEAFVVLHEGHRAELENKLGVPASRIHVVRAGYKADLFGPATDVDPPREEEWVSYAGKLSRAKGLPWLLEAAARVAERRPGFRLHVAGGGGGPEARELRQAMAAMPAVVVHGALRQDELARLLRRSAVFCLPSFYEGLPLVLVEAAACGCRLVCSELPALDALGDGLAPVLHRVPLPRLVGPDTPRSEDLPTFVHALERALEAALDAEPAPALSLEEYTWAAVFRAVEGVWRSVLDEAKRR